MTDYIDMLKNQDSNLVKDLLELSDKDKIIEELQKINAAILRCKLIINNNLTLYPIWVEAYYYNEEKGFTDLSCHERNGINCLQYKLRLHKRGRGGVDLYLGEDNSKNYYLSFLIKLAIIDDNGKELLSQVAIKKELLSQIGKRKTSNNKEKYIIDPEKNLICFKNNDLLSDDEFRILHTKRVNITTENNNYNGDCLASVVEEINKDEARTYETLRKKPMYTEYFEN